MAKQSSERHGGLLTAELFARHGVPFVFTLCGGHISPILVGAKAVGLRVIDVRHEATAIFAADAVSRLSGTPGVALVTAGPGLTNTITAVKNAQMAQSPLILIGGATATMLKGRGALQDIDQMALMKPHVKWAKLVRRVRDIVPALEEAFAVAQSGVPGPVFVELPVDLLYPQSVVREWYAASAGKGRGLIARLTRWYLKWHAGRLFFRAWSRQPGQPQSPDVPGHDDDQLRQAADWLRDAQRPVVVISSQAVLDAAGATALQEAVRALGIPTFLSSMARGLLGQDRLHIRHGRSQALKEADVVLLAGVPFDFRLNYGRSIPGRVKLISVNRSRDDLTQNRRPDLAIQADPGRFLRALAGELTPPDHWRDWRETLQARNDARDADIAEQAAQPTEFVNPVALCRQIEAVLADDSVLIGDGGDFVATASYIVRPRGPLRWLDPGPFGTLGAGAGFALGAKLVRPQAEVWLLYGDGSAGYSLAEFDTFQRHGTPIIAVVGNDGAWAQIAREQVAIFDDDVATRIGRAGYHAVAEGWGGAGLLVQEPGEVRPCLLEAKRLAAGGTAVLLNAFIGQTDFRKGSISI